MAAQAAKRTKTALEGVPRVVLGTMTFGGQTDKAGALQMLVKFAEDALTKPDSEIDTASM